MTYGSLVLLGWALAAEPGPPAGQYFEIEVVDRQTGRGVPLVELTTVNHLSYLTDSSGVVALYEPELMGRSVFFFVKSHGYAFPQDGFGFRGKALAISAGGRARLEIDRINIAQRLYRVTGGGIYADSLLVGRAAPIDEPLLNAQVIGSDSVVNAVYHGKLYWFWGDTNRPKYPLGNFHVPGATSELPARGGLNPELGVNLAYFLDEQGFAKPTARMTGEGPTWIGGLVALGDGEPERLFAGYVKVRGFLDVYERGLVEFDDPKQQFEKVVQFDLDSPLFPSGHPFIKSVEGIEYIYFADPLPLVRVRADPAHLRDTSTYEAFTCLVAGSRLASAEVESEATGRAELDRGADGKLVWAWKRDTAAVDPQLQNRLVESGRIKPSEALVRLQEPDTGEEVVLHSGSVYWNEYRQRWLSVAVQSGGSSPLGEVWYAEADSPLGPWAYARKVVTHDQYSFYNPKHHPQFDQHGGREILFEGTYSHSFSGNSNPTPRYDYNQVMYKLDLSDERLMLPVAVYSATGADGTTRFSTCRPQPPERDEAVVPFFAWDRPRSGTVAIYTGDGAGRLSAGKPGESATRADEPVFYALPADVESPPALSVPLYEFVRAGRLNYVYSTSETPPAEDYQRTARPICRVWPNPVAVELPCE